MTTGIRTTRDYEVEVRINTHNLDIYGGVHDGKDDLEVSTDDQIIIIEYAEDALSDARKTSIADGCDQTARFR